MLDFNFDFWEIYWKFYNGDILDQVKPTVQKISFSGVQNIEMAKLLTKY